MRTTGSRIHGPLHDNEHIVINRAVVVERQDEDLGEVEGAARRPDKYPRNGRPRSLHHHQERRDGTDRDPGSASGRSARSASRTRTSATSRRRCSTCTCAPWMRRRPHLWPRRPERRLKAGTVHQEPPHPTDAPWEPVAPVQRPLRDGAGHATSIAQAKPCGAPPASPPRARAPASTLRLTPYPGAAVARPFVSLPSPDAHDDRGSQLLRRGSIPPLDASGGRR